MKAVLLSILLSSLPALAHRGEPTRTLRLQLKDNRLEGLLLYRVPPGPEAQKLLALPRGAEKLLASRAAAQALLGVSLSIDGQALSLELGEAKVRLTQAGGLESLTLLKLSALPAGAAILEVAAGEPALRVTLGAAGNVKLELLSGVGTPARGGWSLRPRPGRSCRLRLTQTQ